MDETIYKSRQNFSKLVTRHRDNKTIAAGRYDEDAEKEPAIWQDIIAKLGLEKAPQNSRLLDVGCGLSNITDQFINFAFNNQCFLELIDFPEVIEAVREYLPNEVAKYVQLTGGTFPYEMPKDYFSKNKFNLILMYSVIHYTEKPLELIDAAAGLLAPGGKLLVGDIPNLNLKGRFLASKRGREFDANYKNTPIDSIPIYSNHHDFLKRDKSGNHSVNDELIISVLTKFRDSGYDVFILPQSEKLPFCYTREDILICKND